MSAKAADEVLYLEPSLGDDESADQFSDGEFPDAVAEEKKEAPEETEIAKHFLTTTHPPAETESWARSELSALSSDFQSHKRSRRSSFASERRASMTESEGLRLGEVQIRRVLDVDVGVDDGVYALKWAPDGSTLAVGCSDGGVAIVNRAGVVKQRLRQSGGGRMPITALRWKRRVRAPTDCLLLAANSGGVVDFWHLESQKCVATLTESDNQILGLDLSHDSEWLATCGSDKVVRVYAAGSKQLVNEFKGVRRVKLGHTNRVFSVLFHKSDCNLLLSGGWDNSVFLWDMRAKSAVRSFFGPHIAASGGLDLSADGSRLLTASWRQSHALQTWDFGTGKLLQTAEWKSSPMLYCAQFAPQNEGYIAAGGSEVNEVRLLSAETDYRSHALCLPKKAAVYALDFDKTGDLMAVGGYSKQLSIFALKYPSFS